MSLFRKMPSWTASLPSDFSRAVGNRALRVAAQSVGDLFSPPKGLEHLAPHFAAMTLDLAILRNYPITHADAQMLGERVAAGLERLGNGTAFAQQIIARIRVLFPVAIAMKLGTSALVFIVYARATGHVLLTYQGNMTIDEMANAILGIGDNDQ